MFWAVTAHYQKASSVGSVSAEVSAVMFLASVGSLNLINVFARFLPEAGCNARRMILTSYGAALVAEFLVSIIFLITPLSTGLVLGGKPGRFAFAICVVLCSVFMIQDGGLVGFGRTGWVPVENILVAWAWLALLPLATTFVSTQIGILWSWALPMGLAVLVVNAFMIGRLAGRQTIYRSKLPRFRELTSFVAIESVTTAVSASVSAFLPALVTKRLGASQGGYFYVPWVITTMVSLLLTSIMISMVREAVANPERARFTIRRLYWTRLAGHDNRYDGLPILGPPGTCSAGAGIRHLWGSTSSLGWPYLARDGYELLFWATCLVRRRPWPVFAVNLATSVGIIGGVMLLGHGPIFESLSALSIA